MKLHGNLLILTQWSYKDALVQTYTLPYVDIIRRTLPAGKRIFLVTSEQEKIRLSPQELQAVNKEWEKRNMQLIAQPYSRFGIRKLFSSAGHLLDLFKLIRKQRIEVIHSFCTPAGSIGYLLSVLTGKVLVADSYEPHATAMVETGAWKKSGLAFRILFALEKRLTKRAAYIIATTKGMKEYSKENYGVELKDFFIKPACINFEHFYPREKDPALMKELGLEDKLVCLYAGKLGGTYLKEEVFDFVRECYAFWGDRFRFLMLTGERQEEIQQQLDRVGVPGEVVITRFVYHALIPGYMSLADFAINPQVPVPSKRYGTPIKNGEYWAMGLPVIISPGVSDDSEIIDGHHIGVVVNLQQTALLPEAVRQMNELLISNSRESLQRRIFEVARTYRSFSIAEKIYPQIYES